MFRVLACVALAFGCLTQTASAAAETTRKASVFCMLSETSAFPFSAGNDRCFQEINGQKAVLKSANVCAEETTAGPRLYFIYSATPKAACIIGSPATKEQYSWGLDALGPQEKAFFLNHIDSR